VVAWLIYRCVERPFLMLRDRLLPMGSANIQELANTAFRGMPRCRQQVEHDAPPMAIKRGERKLLARKLGPASPRRRFDAVCFDRLISLINYGHMPPHPSNQGEAQS
jgi:hypothetical protein